MNIYFDMDGTIADLYGVDNWLEDLIHHDSRPYREARPLVNMGAFARQLRALQKRGHSIGIISWLSKNSNEKYDREVAECKRIWLRQHLPSIEFDEVHIVEYGTPKSLCGQGILFDDEPQNREEWGQGAFSAEDLLKTISQLLKNN